MDNFNSELISAINKGLLDSEKNSDIVITTGILENASKVIAQNVQHQYAGVISRDETIAVINLIFQAIEDEQFFDWEKPTLCGADKTQFEQIRKKLMLAIGI
ncbi:hypothetical protein Q4520_21225 [Alteromonas sp. 1_MG-2023]|uniref:hypothetical protein n=1 Tax=Alteromonas sp. 1_MG-2023 TaxID=3062669 RepID=UPI0026E28FD2|nr:hypothetical protein [Alteromonas sp. 1_MG-2023]MDO6477946.1 hypothetical protein [Alteromonas sp. 1_MG-2023]